MKEKFLARIVSGYRVTIPPVVRKRLSLSLGDIVNVELSEVEVVTREEEASRP